MCTEWDQEWQHTLIALLLMWHWAAPAPATSQWDMRQGSAPLSHDPVYCFKSSLLWRNKDMIIKKKTLKSSAKTYSLTKNLNWIFHFHSLGGKMTQGGVTQIIKDSSAALMLEGSEQVNTNVKQSFVLHPIRCIFPFYCQLIHKKTKKTIQYSPRIC